MKKNILLLSILLVFTTSIFAQQKNTRINIGVPLGKYGKFDHNFVGSNETNSPSLLIEVQQNWKKDLSIGAYIGYLGQKQEFNLGFSEVKYNYYRLGTSLTYELNHWLSEMNIFPEYGIEIYTNMKVGFSIEHKKASSTDPDASNNPIYRSNSSNDLLLDLGVLLGTRYHFTDQFGIFSEFGWGNGGFLTIGTTFTL